MWGWVRLGRGQDLCRRVHFGQGIARVAGPGPRLLADRVHRELLEEGRMTGDDGPGVVARDRQNVARVT